MEGTSRRTPGSDLVDSKGRQGFEDGQRDDECGGLVQPAGLALVGGGAVGCGRAKGYDYEEVGGMPVEYAGTAAGIAGYMATKRVEFLYAAAGFAAPYLAEMTEDQVRDYREGEDE